MGLGTSLPRCHHRSFQGKHIGSTSPFRFNRSFPFVSTWMIPLSRMCTGRSVLAFSANVTLVASNVNTSMSSTLSLALQKPTSSATIRVCWALSPHLLIPTAPPKYNSPTPTLRPPEHHRTLHLLRFPNFHPQATNPLRVLPHLAHRALLLLRLLTRMIV